jgi:hypothetical protein
MRRRSRLDDEVERLRRTPSVAQTESASPLAD